MLDIRELTNDLFNLCILMYVKYVFTGKDCGYVCGECEQRSADWTGGWTGTAARTVEEGNTVTWPVRACIGHRPSETGDSKRGTNAPVHSGQDMRKLGSEVKFVRPQIV